MQTNQLPHFDDSVNTTGCCPKFNPEGWDGQRLHFEDKPFVRARTRSVAHVPLNMGQVFGRIQDKIAAAGSHMPEDYIVLSRDLSPWSSEHLFATAAPIADEDSATLTGDFITKVFEGPYRNMGQWRREMVDLAEEHGGTEDEVFFYYTTCPKCAKAYGENYVVGIARI